ncbi:MAG: hypothetical protein AAF550_08620 [Myxococcota bacterium]
MRFVDSLDSSLGLSSISAGTLASGASTNPSGCVPSEHENVDTTARSTTLLGTFAEHTRLGISRDWAFVKSHATRRIA